MKLSDYNEKCVRITLKDGSVFEGVCMHAPEEFCEIECGVNEECLEISGWLFGKSNIASVELIDEDNPFLAPFGVIEEETVRDGADAVLDILTSEEPENSRRLLCCLEDNLKEEDAGIIADKDAVVEALKTALKYVQDDVVTEGITKLLSDFG
ncbi:MAG: hypothetical protein K5756_05815 [Clostridiales bacterium]|nr:hypothetical protein [Clostridiales bacterium]